MRSPAMVIGLALLLGAVHGSCGEPGPPPAPTWVIELSTPLSEAAEVSALALAGQVEGARFPRTLRKSRANAGLFVQLAARDTRDLAVAAASLEAMSLTWDPTLQGDHPVADADYATVVLAYLDRDEDLLLARALQASVPLLSQGHRETAERVATLSARGGPTRYAALDALRSYPQWTGREPLADAFVASLEAPEPWNLSLALEALTHNSSSLSATRAAQVTRRCTALLTHEDPGVRGRAAVALAHYAPDDPATAAALQRMLGDGEPYPRAAAIASLDRIGAVEQITAIAALLDDTATDRWHTTGWYALDGEMGSVQHTQSTLGQVREVALRALSRFSRQVGEAPFGLEPLRPSRVNEDLDAHTATARAWLQTLAEPERDDPSD